MPLRTIADESKTVVLVESSHPEVADGSPFTFRRFFTGASGRRAFERFIHQAASRRVAILNAEEEWGEAIAGEVIRLSNTLPFEVVGQESFAKDQVDVRLPLIRLQQKSPDLLYIIGLGAPVAAAYRIRAELGLRMKTLGFAICGQSSVIANAGQFLPETYSLEIKADKQSERYKALLDRFRAKYPGERID